MSAARPIDSHTPCLLAKTIFEELLADLLLTTAISAHREIKRGRVLCGTCGTKCRSHLPLHCNLNAPDTQQNKKHLEGGLSNGVNLPQLPQFEPTGSSSSSLDSRVQGYDIGPERGTGGTSGIGSGSGRMDGSGNVFFDCLVTSTRYAPHLSSCLGFNGSTRRGASRMAATKARLGTNDRLSPSPHFVGSDNEDSDGDTTGGKNRRTFNGNGKRGRSPNTGGVIKKTKPVSGSATPTTQFPRQALPPSRLGRPPTVRQSNPIDLTSPISSPESNVEVSDFGTKTLPGTELDVRKSYQNGHVESSISHARPDDEVADVDVEEVPGDESSEGADDDY
ncbi:MAG: hypothetical protein TREMPRED_004275 [Tremellales sp. Tagirdzhanova-0007]|nr:MAG: hypothetical protein TREMPRED_004275 [Tremellales sp. Tagirdzhanova-0007]